MYSEFEFIRKYDLSLYQHGQNQLIEEKKDKQSFNHLKKATNFCIDDNNQMMIVNYSDETLLLYNISKQFQPINLSNELQKKHQFKYFHCQYIGFLVNQSQKQKISCFVVLVDNYLVFVVTQSSMIEQQKQGLEKVQEKDGQVSYFEQNGFKTIVRFDFYNLDNFLQVNQNPDSAFYQIIHLKDGVISYYQIIKTIKISIYELKCVVNNDLSVSKIAHFKKQNLFFGKNLENEYQEFESMEKLSIRVNIFERYYYIFHELRQFEQECFLIYFYERKQNKQGASRSFADQIFEIPCIDGSFILKNCRFYFDQCIEPLENNIVSLTFNTRNLLQTHYVSLHQPQIIIKKLLYGLIAFDFVGFYNHIGEMGKFKRQVLLQNQKMVVLGAKSCWSKRNLYLLNESIDKKRQAAIMFELQIEQNILKVGKSQRMGNALEEQNLILILTDCNSLLLFGMINKIQLQYQLIEKNVVLNQNIRKYLRQFLY